MIMDERLCTQLKYLAGKYETVDFLKKDPSQFMHRFSDPMDQEIVALISASLAFGRRDQILSHVEYIMEDFDAFREKPVAWILSEHFKAMFPESEKSFYRTFSFLSMRLLCSGIREMIEKDGSIGGWCKRKYLEDSGKTRLSKIIASHFPAECKIIPHSETTAAKRLNLFLRWMVRDSSPVDLGLWSWYPKSELLIPMDVHVVQEATRLGLIEKTAGGKTRNPTMKTAVELTEKMREIFPDDPARADFALFGLGVDGEG